MCACSLGEGKGPFRARGPTWTGTASGTTKGPRRSGTWKQESPIFIVSVESTRANYFIGSIKIVIPLDPRDYGSGYTPVCRGGM